MSNHGSDKTSWHQGTPNPNTKSHMVQSSFDGSQCNCRRIRLKSRSLSSICTSYASLSTRLCIQWWPIRGLLPTIARSFMPTSLTMNIHSRSSTCQTTVSSSASWARLRTPLNCTCCSSETKRGQAAQKAIRVIQSSTSLS